MYEMEIIALENADLKELAEFWGVELEEIFGEE